MSPETHVSIVRLFFVLDLYIFYTRFHRMSKLLGERIAFTFDRHLACNQLSENRHDRLKLSFFFFGTNSKSNQLYH
jgi:hypothetical protein